MNVNNPNHNGVIPILKKPTEIALLSDSELCVMVRRQGCKMNIDKVNWPEYPYAPKATAHLAHDGEKLYCLYDVTENNLRVETLHDNGPVWEDSCVELFVADADGKHYYNFETNAIGTALASRRISRTECVHFLPEAMDRITRIPSLPRKRTDRFSEDGISWQLLVAIPFTLMGYEKGVLPDALRINLYKCGDKTNMPHFLSWAPVVTPSPDFHRPEFFEKVELEKAR